MNALLKHTLIRMNLEILTLNEKKGKTFSMVSLCKIIENANYYIDRLEVTW